MRLTIHVALILLLGIGGGVLLRTLRNHQISGAGGYSATITDRQLSASVSSSIPVKEQQLSTDGYELLKDFELTERSGRRVTSQELVGQPYLVSFFFSTCPSVCVMQNQKLQELQREFAGTAIKFVSITVDPEVDRPEVLSEYARRFGADKDQWLFLTGDNVTYIRRVAGEMYRVHADKQVHVERFLLIDRDGKQLEAFSWGEAKQFARLKDAIRKQLQ